MEILRKCKSWLNIFSYFPPLSLSIWEMPEYSLSWSWSLLIISAASRCKQEEGAQHWRIRKCIFWWFSCFQTGWCLFAESLALWSSVCENIPKHVCWVSVHPSGHWHHESVISYPHLHSQAGSTFTRHPGDRRKITVLYGNRRVRKSCVPTTETSKL